MRVIWFARSADIDTTVSQMALLSPFFDALTMLRDDDALCRTAQVLQPGRERREPPPAPVRAAARKAAWHAVARNFRSPKA